MKKEMIRKSQQELQVILDVIDECIFVIDREGNFLRCNTAFAKYFNLHPKDVVGKNMKDFFEIECNVLLNFIDKTIAEGKAASDKIQINGRNYVANFYPAEFSEKTSFVYVLKDVTELFLMKDKLYNSYKLTSLGQIVGGIAHEINNPLTGVMGYTDMLLMMIDDESVKEIIKKIKSATETCKKVTEILLFFARQVPLNKTIVNINEVIETVLVLRGYNLCKLNIEVIKKLNAIPYTLVDIQQIEIALLSMIINAEEAIEESGKKGKIILETEQKNDNIYVKIIDNGIGIKPEYMKHIFEPFFTTKDIHRSMGLGMSMVYSIIKEHDGDIEVESIYGEGTKFVIIIPVRKL